MLPYYFQLEERAPFARLCSDEASAFDIYVNAV